jgi:hypothetical protein
MLNYLKVLVVVVGIVGVQAAQADYTYTLAKDKYATLSQPTVADALGSWKMVSYAFSKSSSVFGTDPNGIKVGGSGTYAHSYERVFNITYSKILFFSLTKFKITNTDELGPVSKTYSFLKNLSADLPEPETSSRSFLKCRVIEESGISKALLCQERGISSGSVYYSCYTPINSSGYGACDL